MAMTRKTKAVGRPKMAAAEKRDTLIKVLCTAEERDRLQAAADQMGVSLSTWVRLAAVAAAKP
jgi:uncharacterized protein (DUF1778 family)